MYVHVCTSNWKFIVKIAHFTITNNFKSQTKLTDTHTHTHTHSLSLTYTHTLSNTHTHTHSLSHTHTHTHSLSLSLSLSHTLSLTHTHKSLQPQGSPLPCRVGKLARTSTCCSHTQLQLEHLEGEYQQTCSKCWLTLGSFFEGKGVDFRTGQLWASCKTTLECTHTCTHIHTCTTLYNYIHTTCIYTYMYIYTHTQLYNIAIIHIYVHVHVHMHIHTYNII